MTKKKPQTNVERLYGIASGYAEDRWGMAWGKLTLDHQKACVDTEILGVMYQQDRDMDAERFRQLTLDLIEMNREFFEAKLEAN